MRRKVAVLFIGVLIVGLLLVPHQAWAKEIKFAMSPRYANTVCFEMMSKLLQYLSEKTGQTFTQVFPKSYDDHLAMCKAGEVDVSYSNPIDYIKMAPKAGTRPTGFKPLVIAVLPPPEGAEYWGIIITRSDSGITKIEDLKGKKGMYIAPSAVGGYLCQVAYLKDKGIDAKKDLDMIEAPGQKQDKAVMAVYNREVDYAFVRNEAVDITKDRIDITQIKTIVETPKVPQWVIATSATLDAALATKIQQALQGMDKNDPAQTEVLKAAKVASWKIVTDSDFDSIRTLADKTDTAW